MYEAGPCWFAITTPPFDRPVGLVVKALASRAADLGSTSVRTVDLFLGRVTPVT